MKKPGLKGVYKLNPTKAVMKQGSRAAKLAVTSDTEATKRLKRLQKRKNK
jgi:hypothetical protein